MFAGSMALLMTLGCAARAWRHGHVLASSPDGFVLRERYYPHTEIHVSSATRFQCKKNALQLSDLQSNEAVSVEGHYRQDGSIEATKVSLYRKRSECATGAAFATTGEYMQTFPRPNWDLKYRSGSSQLKKEQWLKGAFVADGAAEKQIHPAVVISRDQVRAIYFDPKAQKDSDVVQRMPRSGCYQASSLMPKDDSAPGPEVFLVWVESRAPIARAAEHLNARYPVRFVWSDNGTEKELVLTVNYCEYASFVANLRWFAGQRWQKPGREFPR
jgi:hypothetical protein